LPGYGCFFFEGLMPKLITALRPGRYGRTVTVVLDGEESFPVSKITAAALQPGQALEAGEIEGLKRASPLDDSYGRCLALIARRPRSRAELERYLRGRKLAEAQAALVLARLAASGWIDDRKFAREWVDNRLAFRPRSALALRMELRRKGVADDDTGEALAGIQDDAAALAAARKKAPRLLRASAGLPDAEREFQRKMTAFLASRGFDYGLARETARTVWGECSPAEEAEQK
jgi:regulatory protein